jgi:hypothetical protein
MFPQVPAEEIRIPVKSGKSDHPRCMHVLSADTNERSLEEFLKVTSWLAGAVLKEKKKEERKKEKRKEERKKSKQALIANYVRSRKIR